MESLEASLRLILDETAPELVDADAGRRLSRLAQRLAPIHCAGFEVRLGGGDTTVDLIQRLSVLRGEPARQARFIADGPLGQDDRWRRVQRFCNRWSRPGSIFHRLVLATFLGFDAAVAEMPRPAPSLYLSLEPGAGTDVEALSELVGTASRLLRGAAYSAATLETLAACHEALPEGAAITDIGIMLARDVDAVRLVVAHVPRIGAPAYLERLRWGGPPPRIDEALTMVPASLSHVIVSLDAGSQLLPRVGVEYYPGYRATDLPSWSEALHALSEHGLCAPGKRDALLDWPGHVSPITGDRPWPAGLLTESLLNRSDRFLVLARRLTFLKIVCDAVGPRQAKAYFGYGPRSLETDSGPAASAGVEETDPRRPGAPITPQECAAAVARGIDYCAQRRHRDGLWHEFPRILAGTDEWASAYIGAALASLDDNAEARALATSTWETIRRARGAADGWGYNGALPPDADSTLWGLRLARALGCSDDERARAARRVLVQHQLPGGGLATYTASAEAGLRRIIGNAPLDGLLAMHVCVTAAAATLLESAIPPLIEAQEPDGRWRGYWWSDDEYTTWLAVESLRRHAGGEAREPLRRARRWALTRFDRNRIVWSRGLAAPSVFSTALGIAVVLATSPRAGIDEVRQEPLRGALRWLLDAQGEDGGWGPAALMRMPPTDAVDGDQRPEATAVSVDDHRLFTTATILRVLGNVLRSSPGRGDDQGRL